MNRILIRKEFTEHMNWILSSLAVLLVLTFVFQAFSEIGWVLAAGAFVACYLGMRIGGSEAMQGTYEFLLTRPPARKRVFAVKFLFGLIAVIVLAGVPYRSFFHHLVNRFWGLFVESGRGHMWINPKEQAYWLPVLLAMLGCYVFTFVAATKCHTPRQVNPTFLLGAVLAAAPFAVVAGLFWLLMERGYIGLFGYWEVPWSSLWLMYSFLTGLGVILAAIIGWRAFQVKEV